jgi:hypothetical protein
MEMSGMGMVGCVVAYLDSSNSLDCDFGQSEPNSEGPGSKRTAGIGIWSTQQ